MHVNPRSSPHSYHSLLPVTSLSYWTGQLPLPAAATDVPHHDIRICIRCLAASLTSDETTDDTRARNRVRGESPRGAAQSSNSIRSLAMPLPHAHSLRQLHASQPNSANPLSPSVKGKKAASAASSPRSAAASKSVSPGSAKSPPSTDYVKSRLKNLYMSPKASKMPPVAAARHTLSPIASPLVEPKARLAHSAELLPRSLSSSPSVSTSTSLHSHSSTEPTSHHAHSPLLAPLPPSLTSSPLRPPATLPASVHASLPTIAAPSAAHLPLPSGPLLPDHLSPRWAELRKEGEEEHKESEHDVERLQTPITTRVTEAAPAVADPISPMPLPLPHSPSLSEDTESAPSTQGVPSLSLPVIAPVASTASAEPSSSHSSSARVLQHSVSLPPVLEVERETSSGESKREEEQHDVAQQVLRSASLPLTPRTAAPSAPLPPPVQSTVLNDASTDWDAVRARQKGSSVTRIERLVTPMASSRTSDEASAAIPEGDEAAESVAVPVRTTRLSIDATSPTDAAVAVEAAPLTSTRGSRHHSIEGAGDGDYPLSPLSAAEAFDTLAAQNAAVAPLQLSQPQFAPVQHPLQMQHLTHLTQPYGAPLMSGFSPAMSANPFAMHPGYAQYPPPTLPGLPMPGLPYGVHPMDTQYQQYLIMQQQQQQQLQQQQQALMAAAAAAQAEPPRSYSSASFHSYSPAPFTRTAAQSISYTPHAQMHYSPTPAGYPQPPTTFSQSRLSLATVHSPSPVPSAYGMQPRTSTSAGVTDIQARLAFFRDIANNRHADVKEQLERGMTPHCTDRHGNTPLHIACQHGLRRIVKSLLRVGADINAGNREGNTPLHMCYAYHYEELGDYLKSKGANDRKLNVFNMSCYDGLKPSESTAFAPLDSPAVA